MAYLQDTSLKRETFYTGQIVKPFEPIILDALMNYNQRAETAKAGSTTDIVIGTAVMASLDDNGNLCMHNLDNTEDKLNIYGVAVKETLSFTTEDNTSSIIFAGKVGRVLRFGNCAASFVPYICGDVEDPVAVVKNLDSNYTVKVVISLKAGAMPQGDNTIVGGFFYDLSKVPQVDKYLEFSEDQLKWRLMDGKLYIERGTDLLFEDNQIKQNA